jgi:multiple sugar transport system substrate-binding protein
VLIQHEDTKGTKEHEASPHPRAFCVFLRALRAFVLNIPAVAVVACGGSRTNNEVITLRFWAFGREGEVVQELLPEFERRNPGIRVEVQQIPWTAAHEKLLTAYVGDATPDLAQMGNTWIPEFAALGALEPLDRRLAASQIDSAAYFSGIWDTNVIDDSVYGIPWYVDTRVIFYRKDVLRRAGYSRMPVTWADWQAAMRAIKDQDGQGRYAVFLPTDEWAQPYIFGMQAGSPLLRDDGRYGAFSEPPFRRAFEFYVGLFRSGLAPALGNVEIANAYQEFARGRFAMWITGPWNLGEFRRRLPSALQDEWGTAPLPGPDGEASRVSLALGASLTLFRASADKAAAWRLVEYLSDPEQQARFYRLTGDLPARTQAWTRSGLAYDPLAQAFWVQLHRVRALPKVPETELIATRVFESAEQVIRGSRPVDAALNDLDRDVARILEKRRWVLARRSGEALGK